jgi:uncharacterized membrane protein YdjX (TVP38/TMEM64 family)
MTGPAGIIEWLRASGGAWWAIPLYAVVYALFNMLFIPTQALSITAVVLWGWVNGGIVELVSATVGALFPYLIARTALRDRLQARLQKHRSVSDALNRESFTVLLLLRVVPLIPYTALNYVAGLSTISVPRYLLATFLGIIPSTFIFAYFVDATVQGVIAPRDVVIRILAAGALLAALIIATRLAAPKVRARMSRGHTSPPPIDADRD